MWKKQITFGLVLIFMMTPIFGLTQAQLQDRPLKIRKKPHVKGFKVENCSQRSGTSIVSTVFDKSGSITKADIITASGCDSFDALAVEAAFKIKFDAEIKGGEPITVIKRVEYKFWY